MKFRLSSRQSALAQAQAYQVGKRLEQLHPQLQVDYLFRESLGDKNLTDPLWKMPEKGVFTEDFLMDLIENKTELIVHSWKDLPTEVKAQTHIVASLPRVDQRDLLLFKKSSMKKKNLQIYSSSPRRAHNIKPLLRWALPWGFESLDFHSVRGNIPTRIQKLLDSHETDGLILAKAALDRLLSDSHFPETTLALRRALSQLEFMVLPVTENPNAAAQGALALEISRSRPDIEKLVSALNDENSFRTATREREILKEFGGGCHLALGMSVLERPYGRIEIVKGLTPGGEPLNSKKFFPVKPKPADLKWGRLEFVNERMQLTPSLQNLNAFFVSKSEAWSDEAAGAVVWAAGLHTWKKLAGRGIWVHGSSEGLGEAENPGLEYLSEQPLRWGRLTHSSAPESQDKINCATYELKLTLASPDLGDLQGFQWKSGSEFLCALKRFPELKDRYHICGPGRTYEVIKNALGSDQNLFVELVDGFITII